MSPSSAGADLELQVINYSRILAGYDHTGHTLKVPKVPSTHSEHIYYSNQHQ